jgi:hypothetical protein
MAEQRIITVSGDGCINVKTVNPDTNYCHRYVLTPSADLAGQPEDVVTAAIQAWTPEVTAAWNTSHPPLSSEELARREAIRATQLAKAQAILDNLPSWSVVGGKFDTMLADATAATNLAQAKAVLIELIKTCKKIARVEYWIAKDTEE